MSYSKQKKEAVASVIDTLSLERYTVSSVSKIATDMMDNNSDPDEIADTIFDYLYNNNLGDTAMAAGNNLLISREELYLFRHSLLGALNG